MVTTGGDPALDRGSLVPHQPTELHVRRPGADHAPPPDRRDRDVAEQLAQLFRREPSLDRGGHVRSGHARAQFRRVLVLV